MGTFDGLSIGRSALLAQRRAIDVAGQNLANVNTDGYSRQRVDLVADSGPVVTALFAKPEGGGMGVRVVGVDRLRDAFLEARAHREHAVAGYLGEVQRTYEQLELALAEPGDTGLGAALADLWAGFDDVGLHPGDTAARSQLLERAATLTASFRHLDDTMSALADRSLEELGALVTQVQATAGRIADLNGSIRSAVASGLSPNALMDERDLLALELSQQVGATTRANEDGSLDVYVGGMALVRSSAVEPLALVVHPGPPPSGSVVWADDGLTAPVGGRAQGLLETAGTIVPQLRGDLAALAQQVHDEVNALHGTGFDLDGDPGEPFFVLGPNGLQVNPLVAGDPRRIAAAATPGTLDGSVATRLAELSGPDQRYRELVVRLGVAAQSTNRRVGIQDAIVRQVDAARESVAGVSIDEEMTDLVAFQHAYSAAARFVTVVDELLETIIRMV